MKTSRKQRIIELIQEECIETQDRLMHRLDESGYTVTQATVSRDIKELRLMKVLDPNGKYRYVMPKQEQPDMSSKFSSFFADAVVSVNNGQNIVCIKCQVGMAQAVCASLDNMRWEGIVGTLAGDDTIFVLCSNVEAAENMVDELKKLYSQMN